MEFSEALPFLQANHRTVVTTFRRSGAPQMSIVQGGPYQGKMVFVVRGNAAKLANLRRDPRCTVLAVSPEWSGWVAVEGTAATQGWDDTGPEELRLLLREVYRAAGGDHPDYDEFDRVMREERRAVVMVTPENVYGLRYSP